jgi:hypothetical protein
VASPLAIDSATQADGGGSAAGSAEAAGADLVVGGSVGSASPPASACGEEQTQHREHRDKSEPLLHLSPPHGISGNAI